MVVTVRRTELAPSETTIVLRRRFPAALFGIVHTHLATSPRMLLAAARSDRRASFAGQLTRLVAPSEFVTRIPIRRAIVNLRPA